MLFRRNWRNFPPNLRKNLGEFDGVVGAAGVITTVSGLAAFQGDASSLLAAVGIFAAVCALIHAVLSAIPNRYSTPSELVGSELPIESLEQVWPPITRIGILGPQFSGKSTLKERILHIKSVPRTTQAATARICALPNSKDKYVAILDGDGFDFTQQLDVLESSDCIVFVGDHNPSATEAVVVQERLKEHEYYITQFIKKLGSLHDRNPSSRNQIVHTRFLINKHDLWHADFNAEQLLNELFGKLKEKWEAGRFSKAVDVKTHSNEQPESIADLVDLFSQMEHTKWKK